MKKVIIFIICLGVLFLLFKNDFFEKRDELINFSQSGNIVKNNPGMEEGVWFLIYDEPGSPAKNVKLIFDKYSVCENSKNSCSDLNVGDRYNVDGILNEKGVIVRLLKLN